jgi:nucleotide-binding universal stress UspA family protein
MIKKILAPVDGSRTAQKALEYALDLAKQLGAPIILLSVIDKSPFYGELIIPAKSTSTHLLENLEDYLRQVAEACVARAEQLCKSKKVKSLKIIKEGKPVEEIIKTAKASKADLIVLGSHGKSALRAALLGSVTTGVMYMEKKIPVLVVRR